MSVGGTLVGQGDATTWDVHRFSCILSTLVAIRVRHLAHGFEAMLTWIGLPRQIQAGKGYDGRDEERVSSGS